MADFWEKAEEALKIAELAYQNGCYNEAVGRSYFAALKAALALLEAIGLRPEKTTRIGHWVQANFATECVHRRKLVPRELASILSELRSLRAKADYARESVTAKEARQALRWAQEFLDAIQRRLSKS